MSDGEHKDDSRIRWLELRVGNSFRHIKAEKLKKAFNDPDNVARIKDFFDTPDTRMLVFYGDTNVSTAHVLPARMPRNKPLYFIKVKDGRVNTESIDQELLVSDVTSAPLEHLELIMREVYLPLLSNANNQEGWGEVSSKEIMDRLHSFLAQVSITVGQTQGQTCLPLPSVDTDINGINTKDRIHVLEGAVITWTKQIKNVLKQDPEMLLKQGMNPTPDIEVEFWKSKATNLNSIFEQLQSRRIRRVLKFLDVSKSTYCNPFAKLCKEVYTARLEANDNVRYLRALEPWFDKLEAVRDFPELVGLFRPIMHVLLLIWKNSKYFNTPARLVVLMREMCNSIINKACNYVSGQMIFDLIADESAGEAVSKLKTTLKVCGLFKSTYFDYKTKANNECPNNPWRIQNNALFMRLDSFLERCHDILDLTQTIVQFSMLAKIEIGGTKGKTLTNSVSQIYLDFDTAVETFKNVPYDIMDVGVKQFDDDFYEFRCRIKELERRLGSVLTQGFDDCATIYGRFKLLDSFEGLLERPIIQDELEKKHVALVQAYGADLKRVQEQFLLARDAPPISWNLPPIAGSLTWCRGLKERIQEPMAKLRMLNDSIMDRDEAREVVKVYSTIMVSLDDYEHQKIQEWGSNVEQSSQAKLRLPLLARQSPTTPNGTGLLRVNFDPALVRLLREVKYFLLLKLDVPSSALDIYRKAETYRTQTGNLDLIVNMYNRMMTELLPVEAPLMESHLKKIDQGLRVGIQTMSWKSSSINDFISKVQGTVKTAHDVLFNLKSNLRNIQQTLDKWSVEPLMDRKMKPVAPDEFAQAHKALLTGRYAEIKEGGQRIEKTLKASHAILKVSKGHPDWRSYVDFVSCVVVHGLSKVVVRSLSYLSDQLNPVIIAKLDKNPVLVIDLNLFDSRVMFNPDIYETSNRTGVRDIVANWINSFYHAATLFRRLDTPEGRYAKDMVDDEHVRMLLARIHVDLANTEEQLLEFREQYTAYAYLWETDLNVMFAEFVAASYNKLSDNENAMSVPDLTKFDAEIAKYRQVQQEVNELRTPTDIGWLRVNSEPIKQALATCVTKWTFMFTEHLNDYVVNTLKELQEFISRVDEGLEEEVVAGPDKAPLKRCMAHIRDVRKSMETRQEMFHPLRDTVALLKTHGISMEGQRVGDMGVLEYLDAAPLKWEATINKTFKKKEEIYSLQTAEMDNIKEQVERFFLSMRAFRAKFKEQAPFSFAGPIDAAYAQLDDFESQLAAMEASAQELNALEDLFELPVSKYQETTDTRRELCLLKTVWDMKACVEHTFEEWQLVLWSDIDTDDLESRNKKLMMQIKRLGDQNQVVKVWRVYKDLDAMVRSMQTTLPLVHELHSPAMRDRHWKSLAHVCHAKPIDPRDAKFCLQDLLNLKLHLHVEHVEDVVETATKELKIEKKLQGIEETWAGLALEYVPHKDSDVRVIKASDEVVESLEAHQMELQTMIGMGKFVDYFRDRVTSWQRDLGNVESVLKEWLSVTKVWASLESIFLGSADIRAQLPDDTKRFEGIDQEFKDLMKVAVDVPNVVNACIADGRQELLRSMTKNLELCQKSLNEYLDMKKKIFPRFYFVSNVALLDILSNGNNPPKIMPYVGDCYDSIKRLTFQPATEEGAVPNVATQMIAKDGEVVDFYKPFEITGAVENWLNELTQWQQQTLAHILEQAVDTAVNWDVEKPRHVWLNDYPAQVVLVGTQIFWSDECRMALEDLESGAEDAVKRYLSLCNDRLQALIQLVLGQLPRALRTKIISLITMDVHGRDTVQKLITQRADGPMSFVWQQQLRFEWVPESRDVLISITDFKSTYSYEWVGNSGRLVITPLTDRCYITLTMALRLMLGGAPAGPAGTGKTETTKDLARALALPCYVFNCSDQMNYQTMADIFKGLSQTGSWGCFDEFNRIPIEVLSVVATQVKSVLDAIVKYSVPANREPEFQGLPAGTPPSVVGSFDLMGDTITLIPTVGFFITMNPGYAGRTELPENLKALFRSCAMIRPDLALICENMLLSEGFMRARPLSIKFVTLYQLSSELLSPQAHYDWGLRSVKSVLRVAGSLKRAEPHIDEEAILMRALRDFNTPKMPTVDLPIFLRLVQDLFPSHYQLPTKFSTAIRDGAVQACKNAKLQYDPGFIAKVVQLQELLDVRHSVMLIGPAGCGKTTIWKMLQGCHNLGKAKPTSISVIVNPKAVTSDELYGYMTLSKDWKDGVLSIIMRGMSKNYKELGYHEYQSNKWVVLDGDIDAVWIESMNTVMDDNKVLTLVSNERIPLSPAMRMMFEISSLDNATPATVSRAGMLYVNETDVGWRPFTESWLACREDETEKAHLPGLFDKYVEPLYDMVRREFKTVVPLRLINMVKTTCFLLEGLLADLVNTSHNPELIESLFLIALMWAFGGCLSHKSKDGPRRFHDRLESLSTTIKFPKGAVCFDYFFDVAAGEFVPWETKVPDYVPVPIGSGPGETTFGNLVVATVDTVRLTALLDQLARGRHPVMFAGTAGTGKTTLTQDYLRNLDEETLSCTINMNYFMDSAALQLQLEGAIDKRSGRTYGPPTGKTLVYYVDDVNLPYVETYGTQNALSLLRQLMDHGQMYDRADLDLCKLVVDVQFVATMNPTAGSFTINSRLQGHFATFSCTMPSATDLRNIYQAIFAGHTATFDGRVQKMVEKIVNTTVALHESVASKFLPSATKFVYNWNMRELRNVFQGLCLAQPEYYVSTLKVARLWVHECYRVFGDRLTNEGDITQFDTMLRDHSKLSFNDESFEQEELHARPLVYTSFVSQPGSEPVYLPVPTGEEGDAKLSKVLMEKLEEYNSSNNIMNLVLFKQAMQHVCRICRIIFNPSGNAMLVGVGGSGKQSLSRLAAFICGYDVVQLSVTSKFTVADLKESLKDMYKSAGVKGNGIVFLMTDSQIVDEKFLVYVNDMLSSGWISDLYARDELDSVFGSLRSEAKAAGIPDTPETMLEFFISRVRRNLHLVLCFSPVGQAFRVRARRFPGLINCTAIDWFHPWPGPALVSVAAKFLADVELGTPETKENVAYHMAEVHLTVTNMSEVFLRQERRYNYVTPKSFLELIAFYKHLLAEKRTIVGGLIERLATGLATLRKTEADVTELQADLRDTMVRVEEKKNATDNLLHQMGKQRQEAEVQQEKAEEEAKKAAAASAEAEKIQSQAEAELAEAKPAMDAAAEAVKCLNKASLTELKNFSKPPSGVDKVTACCLMMLEGEYKNHKWDRAKKMMAKVDHFLQKLLAFDARTDMTDDLVKKLTPFVQQDGFTYQAMLSKSMAAANLCAWVTNTYAYNRIYVRVKPLMDRLEAAKGRKQAADEALATVMAEVAEVEARLKQLQQTLLEATNEKIAVEREAQACTDRLGLAERLVNGLASEKERWGKEIERLKENEVTLVGDVLLASAFVSYIGAFDHRFRADLWENVWTNDLQLKEIPLSEGVDPLAMLTDNSRTAQMMSEGLPADRISIENGALINSSKRWPLIIDPQLQGIKWLRKKEAENDLQIIQLTQKNWLHAIVTGISQGGTIIIENLGEDVDATLDPVLSRAVYRKGRSMFIKVGDDEVEYDPNFQLYLQTKLSNPHYKPEIQAQCTMVNFIATEKGLQDQLLAKAVNVEKRELEEEKQKLQDAFNRFQIQLVELENQLLERLANAPEDILSDVPLIEGLEATKKAATEINAAVKKGKETEIAINKAREVYVPVAQEGAMLYFMITQLNAIDHMYQYSLDSFVLYFYKAIDEAPKSEDVTTRVQHLQDTLRLTIYTWVSRGLFEDHKLILLSQLTFQLMRRNILSEEEFNVEYFNFLMRGPKKLGDENPLDWLPTPYWNSCLALGDLDAYFAELPANLEDASPRFKEWFNHVTPETEKLPLKWSALDKEPFKKLLVLRCLRPDRLTVALSNFVGATLPGGARFVDCDATLNSLEVLDNTLKDSTPATPIYFILSPGADVVADVDKLATTYGFVKGQSYHNVSMGQGQDRVAMEKLEMGHKQGHWVILNNVHLMPTWLTELEKKLDLFLQEGSHERFRVFLTSDPSKAIPIGVLNRSIKLTNEPPTGLKANLKRAFCSFTKEFIDESESKTRAILFGLCHFHAIMIERKKFGPKGFNMMYPFSLGDLRDSSVCLNNYMENAGSKIPWEDLRYIFGQIMYGGHIVNDFDRLLCVTYLDHFLRDELLDEMELFPFNEGEKVSFKSPSPTTYVRYLEHIEENLKGDTPIAFGLHPNAEIGFRTDQSEVLFRTLQELQPREAAGDDDSQSPQRVAENQLMDIQDRFGETRFDMEEIASAMEDGRGPFQNVFMLECEQVDKLMAEIIRSLSELNLGFAGELTMSDAMEALMNSLFLDRVPESWAKLAWPSLRPLAGWLHNLQERLNQLQEWIANPLEIPRVTWLSGLVNPQSFLTAIRQQTAQRTSQELDKLIIQTDVTKKQIDDVDTHSRDGAFVHGLSLQGARWDMSGGVVQKSNPREMYFQMPVINCRAVGSDKADEKGVYQCPVYKTEQRGPTFVFRAQLRTKSPASRWIMAGVALLMDCPTG